MTPDLNKMEQLGLPRWRFGIDDPQSWLAAYGWDAVSVVAGAPEAKCGHFPYAYVRATIHTARVLYPGMSMRHGVTEDTCCRSR
jgi:hypothetical protein